jgi:hypothetical protein
MGFFSPRFYPGYGTIDASQKTRKRVITMNDKKTFMMVRRESDQMIVKAYFVPRNLPDGVRFSQVVGDAYEKIHKIYPHKDYDILIGGAYSLRDFLRTFPDWAKGAITFESEEWNYNSRPESEKRG